MRFFVIVFTSILLVSTHVPATADTEFPYNNRSLPNMIIDLEEIPGCLEVFNDDSEYSVWISQDQKDWCCSGPPPENELTSWMKVGPKEQRTFPWIRRDSLIFIAFENLEQRGRLTALTSCK